uniref:Uncharacterized protein n=1 Tax=Panagrolaimus sp. ES5 TaxID=591445 RepID=A0AC34GJ24_9BILA
MGALRPIEPGCLIINHTGLNIFDLGGYCTLVVKYYCLKYSYFCYLNIKPSWVFNLQNHIYGCVFVKVMFRNYSYFRPKKCFKCSRVNRLSYSSCISFSRKKEESIIKNP